MELVSIRNLTFTYPEQTASALCDVSLTLERGSFTVLCGPSGSGKSTLLRQLKPVLTPHGAREGTISFDGAPLDTLSPRAQAERIGFVRQSAEEQLVTDKVWHELAFGLESLGLDGAVIRRRVAETAAFFGMEDWFRRDVASLSGGQKQMVNLAAVMVMRPDLLVLDEPTGQLDPIAAAEFLSALAKLNRELGVAVLVSEHRLEEALPLATQAAVLDGGRLLYAGDVRSMAEHLRRDRHPAFSSMPVPVRVWSATGGEPPCPVTATEGGQWLARYAEGHPLSPLPPEPTRPCLDLIAEAREVQFSYDPAAADVLRGLSLQVRRGELLALLGGNGAGKTTVLNLLAGLARPVHGALTVRGRAGLVSQDPRTLFAKKTVREELLETAQDEAQAAAMARRCALGGLLDRHPYDLSGGEQQRLALGKVLLTRPDLLLLDEPTKGLDEVCKDALRDILTDLASRGVGVVLVSHDLEFCARCAHRCALLFDGAICAEGTPRQFFAGNRFYTTAANRMARAVLPEAVTAEDILTACGASVEPPPQTAPASDDAPECLPPPPPERAPLPRWRKLLALFCVAALAALVWRFLSISDLSAMVRPDGAEPLSVQQLLLCWGILASVFLLALCSFRRSQTVPLPPRQTRRPARRTRLAAALILLLIPLTLLIGQTVLGGRHFYAVALLVLLETMLPFFLIFEGKRPQARELVLIAAMCAIGVAGRAALFILPQCKPILALTVVTGVALGGEAGFLVGSMTMLLSNVLFAQGPWMPWQMFAMGIVGFLAGAAFRKGLLRRDRLSLSLFGAVCAVVIYGGIMNPAAALMSGSELRRDVILAYYLTGFPVDCIHAGATWLFLWFGAEPMLEKLDRVKVKYGLMA